MIDLFAYLYFAILPFPNRKTAVGKSEGFKYHKSPRVSFSLNSLAFETFSTLYEKTCCENSVFWSKFEWLWSSRCGDAYERRPGRFREPGYDDEQSLRHWNVMLKKCWLRGGEPLQPAKTAATTKTTTGTTSQNHENWLEDF